MTRVRTFEERVADVRERMAAGEIRTWADGFNRWHAEVRESYAFPMGVAKLAIWIELQDRVARDQRIPMPQVEQVGSNGGMVTYWEK